MSYLRYTNTLKLNYLSLILIHLFLKRFKFKRNAARDAKLLILNLPRCEQGMFCVRALLYRKRSSRRADKWDNY